MNRNRLTGTLFLMLSLSIAVLVACQDAPAAVAPTEEAAATTIPAEPTAETPEATAVPPTATAEPSATPEPPPTDEPEPTAAPTEAAPEPDSESALPGAVPYNLGDSTVTQDQFPDDSRFRDMPVRLNGVISVPENGGQPAPIVLILHGNHAGCPFVEERGVDVWPCAPEDEQDNYLGFSYLVSALAARGYVALAINMNPQYTLGFGEETGNARARQLVEQHLAALGEAAAGGENDFGVELAGAADLGRLTLIGHSQGGELANWLTRAEGWDQPESFAAHGFGPVDGVLLVAPSRNFVDSGGSKVPIAAILPSCDGDVSNLDGQTYYESVRLDPEFGEFATAVLLHRATHNAFNSILQPDVPRPTAASECELPLADEAQRLFLVSYAADFLAALDGGPEEQLAARAALGLDMTAPVPDTLYELPALLSALAEERRTVFTPLGDVELTTNLLGGDVVAEMLDITYCPEGYFGGQNEPELEICQRRNVNQPGNPQMVTLSWETPEAVWRFAIPEEAGDLSAFTALSLRAAADPVSPLNEPGAGQSFAVRLTDADGQSAVFVVSADEPALQLSLDEMMDLDGFAFFPGHSYLASTRLPLREFEGVDLSKVRELAFLFDQIDRGTLFLGDIEFVRPPQIVGANSSLLELADAANEPLRAVGRLQAGANCTAALIDTGGPDEAPAVALTNGHCVQQWESNHVFFDLPAEGTMVTFDAFVDAPDGGLPIPVERVLYSTMKGYDLGIIELAATVGELQAEGIQPLPLAAALPDLPAPVTAVGNPVSGVPASLAYLRAESCLATGTAELFEFQWRFSPSVRISCQDIYGGSSGSPVFGGDGRTVLGLVNTTTVGGVTPCGNGMPCEVTASGTIARENVTYVVPLAGVAGCFDDAGRFDVLAEACPLDDGRQLLIANYPVQPVQPSAPDVDGVPRPVQWNAQLSGDRLFYRTKQGPAGVVDCTDEAGYSEPIALANSQLVTGPVGPEDGSYMLCVLAGDTPAVDDGWQSARHATVARIEIDSVAPTMRPALNIVRRGEDLSLEPIFVVPELVDFLLRVGPAGDSCEGEDGYARYRRIPITIPAEGLPATVCIIAADMAGNWSEPHIYPLAFGGD